MNISLNNKIKLLNLKIKNLEIENKDLKTNLDIMIKNNQFLKNNQKIHNDKEYILYIVLNILMKIYIKSEELKIL